ncbi:MAG: AAA family ATPase [Lachnospiraceae bacterium]|nr:AAA family ATPase [Lachnospiraceae bacterium]
MKIKKIDIKNYRQYRDVVLTFPNASTYDLNYVLAENGIGKTTLLNAITWCLYGRELHVTEGLKDKTLPLFTLKTLREMETGQEENTMVSITLEDSDGEVTFVRWITFRKNEEGDAYEKVKSQKVVIVPSVGEPDVLNGEEEFKIEVNKRLPFKIQQFFFFDGEQLDTYLANTAGKNVEQAVLEISQIDLLVTMEKNLVRVADDLRREASRGNSQSAKLNSEYEAKVEEERTLKEKVQKDSEDLSRAKKELERINMELGDDPDVSELELERDTLDEKLRKELKVEQEENAYAIKQFLKKYLTLLTALPRLKRMYDIIVEKERNKELPPKYDKKELEEMLSEHTCHVCGRTLDTDATIYVAELIKRYELGQDTGTLLTRMLGPLQMQIQEAKKYEVERDRLFKAKDRIKHDIDTVLARISELDSTIDKYTDKDHIKTLYAKRSELEKFIEDTNRRVIREEIELATLMRRLEELKTELNKALQKDEKNAKVRKEAQLAEKARNKVSEIIADIKGDIRDKISEEMSLKFFELMWKRKFSKVELTDNYSTSVINNDGFECLGSCSAAERELLVLAFTLALHKESGFDGPLVIDTPISRISGELRVAFAKVLREVSKNKQIILFVTEDEYSINVRDVFEPYANRKYRFELVDEDFVKAGDL